MEFIQSCVIPLGAAFLAALLAAVVIVATKSWHGRLSMDSDVGVQKFHKVPTPRVGGIALLCGLATCLPFLDPGARGILLLLLLTGIPAFVSGLLEDVTKVVTPRARLLSALASGLAFAVFSGALPPLADPLVPEVLGAAGVWVVYGLGGAGIAFALAGTTNAVNIIDGFNGLAAGSLVIMSSTIAGLAAWQGDVDLTIAAMVFAAAVGGFMVVNFPRGALFLGDAGAYMAGFMLGALAVLLAARTDVSAFVSILIMAYPVYETLFSIRRKLRRDGHSPSQPDGVHLHMLVSRRYARFIAYGLDRPDWRNPITGVLMWPFSIVAAIMAVFAQGTSVGGAFGLLIFALFYGRIYHLTSLQRPSLLRGWATRQGWDERSRFAKSDAPAGSEV